MHTDRRGNTRRQKCRAKGSGKGLKIQLESVSYTRKTFDGFTTADSYTWNITHNTESNAV
jgi:hypothetical protein